MRLFSHFQTGGRLTSTSNDSAPALGDSSRGDSPPGHLGRWCLGGLVVVAVCGLATWLRHRSTATVSPPVEASVEKDARFDDARVALDAAIKRHPDDPLAHLHYGDLLLAAGDADAAVTHYEIAVRGMPKAIQPRLNLAVALGAIGRMREATECAESVLQIDPSNAEAKAILASLPHTDGTPPSR